MYPIFYFNQNQYSQGVSKKILILLSSTDFQFSEERISKLSSYKNTWRGNYEVKEKTIELHCFTLFSEDMHDAFVHRHRQKIEMDRSRQHSRQGWTSGGIYIGGDDNSGIDKGNFSSCC